MEIKTDDVYKDIKNSKVKDHTEQFDFSNYKEDHHSGLDPFNKHKHKEKNNKNPGLFKDEMEGQIMDSCALCAKTALCTFLTECGDEEKKAKDPKSKVLATDQPSTSTGVTSSTSTINALLNQLRKSDVVSCWKVLDDTSSGFKMELYDDCHSMPKYKMICDSGLTFTLFTYHWPIPDDHTLYREYNRSVQAENINKLLRSIESSQLCEGLPHIPDVKDIAIDPTSNDRVSGTILRYSVPKKLANNEAVNPKITRITDSLKAITKASKQKSRSSSVPAKAKAPLSACGHEKLCATVKATRLQNKQLEDRLEILQAKIEKDGIGVSASFETDLLKIMGGQNLEATPHMKFFWEQQMALMQSKKMGRRYHIQVIRFALSIHGKSPSAYRELQDSGALILPSERVLRDYKNYFKPKAGINKENVECLREKN
ncbi:Hypothetical predicted protein [Paramuricea clavata]|uniref:Uncharacterized protein n=1 Tax=Paramuricea clavata TaxID=317549 RepID=A0A7D9E7S1_PARCT|nr:Hypothetical predicted protein [Paramuricea clavata]